MPWRKRRPPTEATRSAATRSGRLYSNRGSRSRASRPRPSTGSAKAGGSACMIGAAGVGKTTSLQPLVSAWHEQARDVHGIALAWRQADELVDAGIPQQRVKALSVFEQAAAKGEIDAVLEIRRGGGRARPARHSARAGAAAAPATARLPHGVDGRSQATRQHRGRPDYRTVAPRAGGRTGAGDPHHAPAAERARAGNRRAVPRGKGCRGARHEARGRHGGAGGGRLPRGGGARRGAGQGAALGECRGPSLHPHRLGADQHRRAPARRRDPAGAPRAGPGRTGPRPHQSGRAGGQRVSHGDRHRRQGAPVRLDAGAGRARAASAATARC